MDWESQVEKCRLFTLFVSSGDAHPVDMFAQAGFHLSLMDAFRACLFLLLEDPDLN